MLIGEAEIKTNISTTALIDPSAQLGKDVSVGPYTIIEKDVIIGDGTWIDAHAHIKPYTTHRKSYKNYIKSYKSLDSQNYYCS